MDKIRKRVEELKTVSPCEINALSVEETRRACVVLSMLAHSYLNGECVEWEFVAREKGQPQSQPSASVHDEKSARENLAASVAVPLNVVSTKLGMPQVLCHAHTDLWNWKLVDESVVGAKRMAISNLEQVSKMTGTSTEKNFHMMVTAMNALAGDNLIHRMYHILSHSLDVTCPTSQNRVLSMLVDLESLLREFSTIFSDVRELVDTDVFYNVYRPLLGGWYPGGIRLMGVAPSEGDSSSSAHKIVKFKGPSAGQSTLIVMLDQLLGVNHFGTAGSFQKEMLGYMPGKHRQLLVDFGERVKKYGNLKGYAENCSASNQARISGRNRSLLFKFASSDNGSSSSSSVKALPDAIRQAYKKCLKAFYALRAFHMGVTTEYLIRTDTGTGSSDFRVMLKDMMHNTKVPIISMR